MTDRPIPGDPATRDTWGDTLNLHLQESFAVQRAYANVSGGGTVSVDAVGAVSWSSRFIVISNGRGSYFGTSGYFDITMPPDGTVITASGGLSNSTVTGGKITIGTWGALYYILPIGGASASQNGNFRIVGYTADAVVPEHWFLVAVLNADNNAIRFCNGASVPFGNTWASGQLSSISPSGVATLNEISERTNAVTATGATTTLNCDLGMTHVVTQQANTTLAFSGLDATASRVQSVTVILVQDATGGRTVTWPSGTRWPNGVAPTLTTTANAINIVTLMTTNAGTNWYGFLAGAGMA